MDNTDLEREINSFENKKSKVVQIWDDTVQERFFENYRINQFSSIISEYIKESKSLENKLESLLNEMRGVC